MSLAEKVVVAVDAQVLQARVSEKWDKEITPALMSFIKVPAKSPAFDASWAENGYLDQVVADAVVWVKAQQVKGLTIEVLQLYHEDGRRRTPVIYFEVPAFNSGENKAALMYGHLDKQPESSGWQVGAGPWEPVIHDDRLYGRGGADDGYAIYSSVAMVKVLQDMGASHPRIVGLIETCEESGSFDLPPYFDLLRERIGEVSMVVCLDSGAGDYQRLWLTSSLRGMVAGELSVQVGTQGVHSGEASGVMPSSMRIMRLLLERIEDVRTGEVLLPSAQVEVPAKRLEESVDFAKVLGEEVVHSMPWAQGQDGTLVHAMAGDAYEAMLNRTWRATLSVTGVDGIPALSSAGNVLRTHTSLTLSVRVPPTSDADEVAAEMKKVLETDTPYNARVSFTVKTTGPGWSLGSFEPWLQGAIDQASNSFYGQPCGYFGMGGSIPLINMLQMNFPAAQMVVCGVLGPGSNAHGPDEFLDLSYAKKLTACVAMMLSAHPR